MDREQNNFRSRGQATRTGHTLRRAREDLGLSHADVERATKIRARYLEAMERDDYDVLPGAVYSRGFLKTYANHLNLDGERLSRELGERGAVETARPTRSVAREGSNTGRPRPVSRYGRSRRRRFPVAAILASTLGLLVLAGVVAGLYFVGLQVLRSPGESQEGPAQVEEGPSPDETPSEDEPEGPDNAPPDGEATDGAPAGDAAPGGDGRQNTSEAAPPAPPPEKLTLTVRVEDNISWLNIKTDGEVALEQVAQPGFSQTFEADETVTVWSGNAGAVFIEVNGQDYGRLGESGETRIQDFALKPAEN